MINQIVGNFKILAEIGEGGMGIVYLAEHLSLGKCFAVKCLSSELTENEHFRDRFHNEARAQAALVHPNIVQVTDFFEADGQYYLAMEYIDGTGLDALIEQKGKLNIDESIGIFKEVLKGLNFAHSKGVIHRDIKPSNILIDRDNHAKIADFGIALISGVKRKTKTGTNVGTVWYMSPEQIEHPKQIDHRSDVYSMGIILYEMLTGNVPYSGDSDFEIYKKHIHAPPPDIRSAVSQVSPILQSIVFKSLAKNPDERFSGCGEFLEYLSAYEKENRDCAKENGGGETSEICKNCGTMVDNQSNFCTSCGDVVAISSPPSNPQGKRINPHIFTFSMWMGIVAIILGIFIAEETGDESGIVLLLVGFAGILISYIYSFISLYRCWKIIQGETARTTPGKAVGLLFVPFYNFYWCFVAVKGLADDANAYIGKKGGSKEISENLSLVYCILLITNNIPGIGYISMIIFIVVLNVLIYQWARFNNAFISDKEG